jgi:hypothetical protein
MADGTPDPNRVRTIVRLKHPLPAGQEIVIAIPKKRAEFEAALARSAQAAGLSEDEA